MAHTAAASFSHTAQSVPSPRFLILDWVEDASGCMVQMAKLSQYKKKNRYIFICGIWLGKLRELKQILGAGAWAHGWQERHGHTPRAATAP
jgi:hypothetical protein